MPKPHESVEIDALSSPPVDRLTLGDHACRLPLDSPCRTFSNETDWRRHLDPRDRYDIPGRVDIFPFPEDDDAQAK
jgi:hypothetical protein